MQGNGPKGGWEWGLSLGALPHGQLSHRRRRHGSTLLAVLFELYPSSSIGTNLVFLFRKTGTLTCNDAVFLQGLLPADLERCVQNLCET